MRKNTGGTTVSHCAHLESAESRREQLGHMTSALSRTPAPEVVFPRDEEVADLSDDVLADETITS